MKTIKKEFQTIRQAENYLSYLYGKYNYVRLVNMPRFSEKGIYIYQIIK